MVEFSVRTGDSVIEAKGDLIEAITFTKNPNVAERISLSKKIFGEILWKYAHASLEKIPVGGTDREYEILFDKQIEATNYAGDDAIEIRLKNLDDIEEVKNPEISEDFTYKLRISKFNGDVKTYTLGWREFKA